MSDKINKDEPVVDTKSIEIQELKEIQDQNLKIIQFKFFKTWNFIGQCIIWIVGIGLTLIAIISILLGILYAAGVL